MYLQGRQGPLVRDCSGSGGRGARREDARSGSTTDHRTGPSRAGSTTSQTSTSRSIFATILLFFIQKGGFFYFSFILFMLCNTASSAATQIPLCRKVLGIFLAWDFIRGGCMLRGAVILTRGWLLAKNAVFYVLILNVKTGQENTSKKRLGKKVETLVR